MVGEADILSFVTQRGSRAPQDGLQLSRAVVHI